MDAAWHGLQTLGRSCVPHHPPRRAAAGGWWTKHLHAIGPRAQDVDAPHRCGGVEREHGAGPHPSRHLLDEQPMAIDRAERRPFASADEGAWCHPNPRAVLHCPAQATVVERVCSIAAADHVDLRGGSHASDARSLQVAIGVHPGDCGAIPLAVGLGRRGRAGAGRSNCSSSVRLLHLYAAQLHRRGAHGAAGAGERSGCRGRPRAQRMPRGMPAGATDAGDRHPHGAPAVESTDDGRPPFL